MYSATAIYACWPTKFPFDQQDYVRDLSVEGEGAPVEIRNLPEA